MGKLFPLCAFVCLSAYSGKCLTQPEHEQPLDLSFRGIPRGVTVRPNLLPFEERGKPGEGFSIAPDAKKRIILLPAAKFTAPNGQSATVGVRPRSGGFEVKVDVPLR